VVSTASNSAGLQEYNITGTTFAPKGLVLTNSNVNVERPAALPSLLQVAICCSLCNDSSVQYNAERGTYEKVSGDLTRSKCCFHRTSEGSGL
jgi:Ca2+ transporting ATPase